MFVGILSGAAAGAVQPLFALIMGELFGLYFETGKAESKNRCTNNEKVLFVLDEWIYCLGSVEFADLYIKIILICCCWGEIDIQAKNKEVKQI